MNALGLWNTFCMAFTLSPFIGVDMESQNIDLRQRERGFEFDMRIVFGAEHL